jgi:hypothetical protein
MQVTPRRRTLSWRARQRAGLNRPGGPAEPDDSDVRLARSHSALRPGPDLRGSGPVAKLGRGLGWTPAPPQPEAEAEVGLGRGFVTPLAGLDGRGLGHGRMWFDCGASSNHRSNHIRRPRWPRTRAWAGQSDSEAMRGERKGRYPPARSPPCTGSRAGDRGKCRECGSIAELQAITDLTLNHIRRSSCKLGIKRGRSVGSESPLCEQTNHDVSSYCEHRIGRVRCPSRPSLQPQDPRECFLRLCSGRLLQSSMCNGAHALAEWRARIGSIRPRIRAMCGGDKPTTEQSCV